MTPRAAYPAELAADPRPAARRQRRRATCPAEQIEFARTIHAAGSDLLALIDDILDLSKIEAGRMDVDAGRGRAWPTCATTSSGRSRRSRRGQGPAASTSTSPTALPPTIVTDEQRLQQILRNLLSNAVKFTDQGGVTLRIAPADAVAVRPGAARAPTA